MKLLTLRLTPTQVYVNHKNAGCWLNQTHEQLHQLLLQHVQQLSADGTLKIVDDGFSQTTKLYWWLLTQFWAYDWAQSLTVKIKSIHDSHWHDLKTAAYWGARYIYPAADGITIPSAIQALLIGQQSVYSQPVVVQTNAEEYRLGCHVQTVLLTDGSQLTFIELRAVETAARLGYRLVLTNHDKTVLSVQLSKDERMASNGQLRTINNRIIYKAYDKLWIETCEFKQLYQKQQQKWQHFWQLFDLIWEHDYRWHDVYRCLMYQLYLQCSLTEIQQLLWTEPIAVTGDFGCLNWQCQWQPLFTGLLNWLLGGCMHDDQLVISREPQLPLSGEREFTIQHTTQKIKVRLTIEGVQVQPSKRLKVFSQEKRIDCKRQRWTLIWQYN